MRIETHAEDSRKRSLTSCTNRISLFQNKEENNLHENKRYLNNIQTKESSLQPILTNLQTEREKHRATSQDHKLKPNAVTKLTETETLWEQMKKQLLHSSQNVIPFDKRLSKTPIENYSPVNQKRLVKSISKLKVLTQDTNSFTKTGITDFKVRFSNTPTNKNYNQDVFDSNAATTISAENITPKCFKSPREQELLKIVMKVKKNLDGDQKEKQNNNLQKQKKAREFEPILCSNDTTEENSSINIKHFGALFLPKTISKAFGTNPQTPEQADKKKIVKSQFSKKDETAKNPYNSSASNLLASGKNNITANKKNKNIQEKSKLVQFQFSQMKVVNALEYNNTVDNRSKNKVEIVSNKEKGKIECLHKINTEKARSKRFSMKDIQNIAEVKLSNKFNSQSNGIKKGQKRV